MSELWRGGGERNRLARQKGIVDQAVALPGSPEWVDMMAAAAEHHVAKLCGVSFDKQLGTPNPNEFVLPDGRKVDVKWTPRADGSLICYVNAKGDADIYVLVTGTEIEHFRVRGWATAEELHASVVDLGHGPTYVLRQDQLHPLRGTSSGPRCYTCGAPPVGTFKDGSPRYSLETCCHDQA